MSNASLSSENKIMRRVAGYHDIRMDGMTDLVMRAKDQRVLDIGCNRGLVGFEFANNGAGLVHGCDIDEQCILVCRHLFCDMREIQNKFEVVDLTKAGAFAKAFGDQKYDIVVLLATYHKLKRAMSAADLSNLMKDFGRRTEKFFAWRGTSDKHDENHEEMLSLDRDLGSQGLKRVVTSTLSLQLGLAAIWARR